MLLVKKGIFKIKSKNGESVRFVPNTSQQRIIEIIDEAERVGEKTRLIIVKGRQIGGSSLIQRIALSWVMTKPNFSAYTIAHDSDSAKQIFQNHVKYAFDTLPDSFRKLYKVDRDNVNQLRFENEECFNSSITVGQSARSNTIDFLHVSEVAKIAKDQKKWQELITGSFPAAQSGHIILETTAGGFDKFHEFVANQQNDQYSKWKILFLGWFDSEEYKIKAPDSDNWIEEYKELAKRYELILDPISEIGINKDQLYFYFQQTKDLGELVKQEYPFSLHEAFISTADTIFKMSDIINLEKNVREFELKNQVQIYLKPVAGRKYVLGLDPTSGEGGDETALTVYDFESCEQCAEISGKIDPEMVAIIACNLGYYYNYAYIGCEINGNGIATMNEILKLEYPEDKLFKRYVTDISNPRQNKVAKYGFATTKQTRPIMISDFRQGVENGEIKPNSLKLIGQMKVFVNKNGRYEAESGYHDDCIFASMIANQVRKFVVEFG